MLQDNAVRDWDKEQDSRRFLDVLPWQTKH